jgi:RNA polymerase-interacting CarD/CdnL/TRCF family regulator
MFPDYTNFSSLASTIIKSIDEHRLKSYWVGGMSGLRAIVTFPYSKRDNVAMRKLVDREIVEHAQAQERFLTDSEMQEISAFFQRASASLAAAQN